MYRWPLVFRFIKGAIHGAILVQVVLHAIFTAFVVWLDRYVFDTVGLPNSIVRISVLEKVKDQGR
jgi:putative membrane protein